MYALYISRDEQYPDWQRYEVYDLSIKRTVLITEDWQQVVALLGSEMPEPIIVEVN